MTVVVVAVVAAAAAAAAAGAGNRCMPTVVPERGHPLEVVAPVEPELQVELKFILRHERWDGC